MDPRVRQYLGVHLVVDDEVAAGLPVADLHGLAGCDDVLAHALRRPDQRLALAHAQHVVEVLADHAPARVKLMRCRGGARKWQIQKSLLFIFKSFYLSFSMYTSNGPPAMYLPYTVLPA